MDRGQQLLIHAVYLSFLADLEAVLAHTAWQNRGDVRPLLQRIEQRATEWRKIALGYYNREVSAAQRAADAPPEQQTGG